MRLPAPPEGYSRDYMERLVAELERTLSLARYRGDIELRRETIGGVSRDEKLILRSPDGTRYALYVNDYGELHTTDPSTGSVVTIYRWDDMTFSASGINPLGAPSDAVRETDTATWPGSLRFAGTGTTVIAGLAQVPHKARDGSSAELHPHIHWTKTTGSSNGVRWEFFYRWAGNVGSTAGSWSTAQAGTLQAGNMSVSNQHLLTSFPAITLTDRKDSAMLCWILQRNAGHADDTDTNAVHLLEFDIHYESDSNTLGGSYAEYPS